MVSTAILFLNHSSVKWEIHELKKALNELRRKEFLTDDLS